MTASDLSDVFISYRRTNVEFAKKLVDALNSAGKEVWVDWEDIPPGSEAFTDDIKRGLEGADAFLCILSPDYLQSTYCVDMELRYAVQLKKKIIPVIYEEFDAQSAPSSVGHINWIYFIPHAGSQNSFEESFPRIMDALDQDFEHAREHRRLALRAIEWDNNDRKDSFLLNGDEIQRAEAWLIDSIEKVPEPTILHKNYIQFSRKIANQRRRQTRLVIGALIIISSLTVLAIYFGYSANLQRQEAETQANIAATNAQDAHDSAATAVSALDEAELQAQIAATQAAIAENNAITATFAQGDAIVQANEAATQAEIAEENAITATVAQGLAQIAATGEAIARATAAFVQEANANSTQAAIAAVAATEVNEALATSESNALTATVAQGEAELQADFAATQAAIAEENAATATVAQGEALLQADFAATQAAIAEENAATATIAQGEAQLEAIRAETQAAVAEENAATATVAQGEALLEANAAATAEQLAEQRRIEAQAQALTVRAEQARLFGDSNVALALALQAADLNPNLLQTQSVLNQTAAVSPRLIIANVQSSQLRPQNNHLLTQSLIDPAELTLWNIDTKTVMYTITVESPVEDFTFSPDGQFLLAALGEQGVAIWDAETGDLIELLQDQIANRVVAHPDNLRFISAGTDGVIFIRDIMTGEVLSQLTNSTTSAYDQIVFNTDGRWLYAWSVEPPIVLTLWNIENSEPTRRSVETYLMVSDDRAFRINRVEGQFVVHNMDGDGVSARFDGDVQEVYALSADNTQVLVKGQGGRFGSDARLALLNRSTGQIEVNYSASPELQLTSSIQEARFLSDGQTVVSIQPNNDIVISNGQNGEFIRRIGISSVSLILGDNNNTYIATLTENNTVLVFDRNGLDTSDITDPNEKLAAIEQIKATYLEDGGLYGELYDLDWQITSLGGFFKLSTFDGFNLALTNIQRQQRVGLIPNKVNRIDSSIRKFSPNIQHVVLGWRDGSIRVWDIQAGEVLWETSEEANKPDNLEDILFVDGGKKFVAFYGETAILWDIESGYMLQEYALPNLVSPLSRNSVLNNGNVHSWMFIEQHNRILSEDSIVARILFDQNTLTITLVLWDKESGDMIRAQDLRDGISGERLIGARFTNEGQTYVRVGQDGNIVEMFNTVTNVRIRRFIGHTSHPVGVGFNPSGDQLASASEDGEIILWDIQTGQLVRTLVLGNPLQGIVSSYNVVFSPDGSYVGYTKDDTPIPSANLEVVKVETLSDVVNWVRHNRSIRELSCAEREQYSVLPLCDGGVETPTPTATTPSVLVVSPTATLEPTLPPTSTAFPRGVVQADSNVNLRSGPGEGFHIVTSVPPDTIIIILSDQPEGGWIQIELLDGNQGWVLDGVVAR